MSKYLIYLRKSRQDNPNESVEEVLNRHETQLQDYAVKNFGYRIKEEDIYREIVSGETIEDRPQINEVFKRIESDYIKGVLCIECSRLTRGDLLDCGTVVHVFRYTNTLVITPTKTYDLSDKYDRKFFEMELTRGNDYLEYTKEILFRGRKASAFEGNYVSSVPPYGYKKMKLDKGYTLVEDENEAKFVRMIFEWYSQGVGMTTITNRLHDLGAKPREAMYFTYGTLRQMLENETYIGKIVYHREILTTVYEDGKLNKKKARQKQYDIIDGKHKPIIDEELFYKVQSIRNQPKQKYNTELRNIYATLIHCKYCGKAITLATFDSAKNKRVPRYRCSSGKFCKNKSVNASVVHEHIVKSLKDTLEDFEMKVSNDNKKLYETHEKLITQLENELENLEKKQEELYEYLENKIYTKEVFIMRNEKLANDREKLKGSIKKAKETLPTVQEYEDKIITLHKALDMLNDDSISPKDKNMFLKTFVQDIIYEKTDENITLEIFLK